MKSNRKNKFHLSGALPGRDEGGDSLGFTLKYLKYFSKARRQLMSRVCTSNRGAQVPRDVSTLL